MYDVASQGLFLLALWPQLILYFYKRRLEELNLFTLIKKKNHHPVNSNWTGWHLSVTEALENTKPLLPCPLIGIWGAKSVKTFIFFGCLAEI